MSGPTRSQVRGNRSLRFFDRYLGIPLLSVFGLAPRRRLDASRVRRIGLMKTAAIGDLVLLAGIIEDVRAQLPDAVIVLITGEDNAAAARLMLGASDEHLIISPHRPVTAARTVRAAKLDVIVDFGAWPRFDAMLAALSGAVRVGFRTPGQFRHFALDLPVDYSNHGHEIENFRRLLIPIGVRSTSFPHIKPARRLPANRMPRRPYIVFHAWPGGLMQEVKEWPDQQWADLADRIRSFGWQIVLSGSAADGKKGGALAATIAARGVAVVNLTGVLSLAELTDLLAAAEIVVSVNTGIMHLAASVGARVIGLQGPTSSSRWGPLGSRARAVDSSLPGCGYLSMGWEYAGQRLDCMNGVGVDAVVAAINELLPTRNADVEHSA